VMERRAACSPWRELQSQVPQLQPQLAMERRAACSPWRELQSQVPQLQPQLARAME